MALLRKFLRRLFLGCLSLALIAAVALFLYVEPYYFRAQLYDLRQLHELNTTTFFYDNEGHEIGRVFVEDRVVLSHADIPDNMRKCVIAVEDHRFYSHGGVDLQGIARALRQNIKAGRITQGGSTITQQLAKHLIGDFEKTLRRKCTEAFLARRIENRYTKDEILDFYLNRIYFGRGAFGVEAASRVYFNKSAKQLTLGQSAMLAGLIKAPSVRSPKEDSDQAIRWRNHTLRVVEQKGAITHAEADAARSDDLELAKMDPASRQRSYFLAHVMKELKHVLGVGAEGEVPQGLKIYTTLDSKLQSEAENQARELVGKASSGANPLQAAVVLLDVNSAAIRVLVGGKDYKESEYDRATMAEREKSALLHPFLYALAFERFGLHPASMINASYLPAENMAQSDSVGLGDPEKDFNKRFLMIQDALALSNRACAARVGTQLGLADFSRWLTKQGLPAAFENESSVLTGTPRLTLLETVSLYQMLGKGGVRLQPYSVQSAFNQHGEPIYRRAASPVRMLEDTTARQLTLTLQNATRYGKAQKIITDFALPAASACMTDYSPGYRDAWFVGFTPGAAMGVWCGHDDPESIGAEVDAAQTALPLWGGIMRQALYARPANARFPIPAELNKVEVDRRTGAIEGLGFLSAGRGNAFVYLRRSQLNAARNDQRLAAAQINPPEDWADWMNTLATRPGHGGASEMLANYQLPLEGIPQSAEYKMPALRGNILTVDGVALATTIQTQSLVLPWPAPEVAPSEDAAVAWALQQIRKAEDELGMLFDLPEPELRSLYRYQRFHPILVHDALTEQQIQNFSAGTLGKQGFALEGFPRRHYPKGNFFAHGIGYLSRSQGRNRGPYQADEVIYDRYSGAAGLEKIFDRELTGQDGLFKVAVNPEGYARAAAIDRDATPGLNVRTTIDARLQAAAEKSIESIKRGAVVVLDIGTGDIVAMASQPDFNPNDFVPALPPEVWQSYASSEANPLFDRAYRQRQPPGSVFKVITSLAAMRKGSFDPERVIHCKGYVDVGNVRYHLPKETDSVAYKEALTRSINTYFIDLGLRTGRTALIQTAQEMGVGKPTGLILPDEEAGLMPTPEYVLSKHKRWMGPGDVANSAIGQGDVLVTPLQMANWMAAIANNGKLYRPRLVSGLEDASGRTVKNFPSELIRAIELPPEVDFLQEAMVAVVQKGTATAARIPGVPIAAKTGTSQVGTTIRPRQIAWLSGYLPADRPKYSFCVMVEGDFEREIHGGSDAGPIARNIFSEYYGIAPAVRVDRDENDETLLEN